MVYICFIDAFHLPEIINGQITDHSGRTAEGKCVRRDLSARCDETAGAYESILTNNGTVEYGGVHADQSFASYRAAVEGHFVSDSDIILYDEGHPRCLMQDGEILDIGVFSDAYRRDVTPQDCTEPDRGILFQLDIADHCCIRSDKSAFINFRCFSLIIDQHFQCPFSNQIVIISLS